MRTLVYLRTHNGDPGVEGAFGVHNCMGTTRAWGFEAVTVCLPANNRSQASRYQMCAPGKTSDKKDVATRRRKCRVKLLD